MSQLDIELLFVLVIIQINRNLVVNHDVCGLLPYYRPPPFPPQIRQIGKSHKFSLFIYIGVNGAHGNFYR